MLTLQMRKLKLKEVTAYSQDTAELEFKCLWVHAFDNSAVPHHPSPYSFSDGGVIGPSLWVTGPSQSIRGSRQRHGEGKVDDISGI